MSLLFTRSIYVDGALTDADSLPTITIVRTDTNAVVQASIDMVRDSLGKYHFTLTGEATGVVYAGTILTTVNSYTYTTTIDRSTTGTPACAYITYEEFVRRWGTKNVAKASNKDNNNTSPDMDSVQDAFDFAVSEIEGAMSGIYVTPLDWSENSGVIDRRVKEWAKVIAWGYLYEARGWEESTNINRRTPTNRIKLLVEGAYDSMSLVRIRTSDIAAVRSRDSDGEFTEDGGATLRSHQYCGNTAFGLNYSWMTCL